MSANQNKHEAECQTVLQCTPHILSREEEAVVQSDATCQTLVSCDPQNSNSQLCPLLSYTNPEEIKKDAIKELNIPRVRKLQFILPEGHVDNDQVSSDTNTTDKENTECSESRTVCEELQALREEKAEEEKMNDVSNKSDDNTEPKRQREESIALDKEKEQEQKNKDVSKESVRNSLDQDGVQIQSILKHYHDDEPGRRRRRRVKNVDADCQTNLMVYPYMLSPFDTAVVKCDLSVQTSVTCHPTCSLSDILPKLKSYIVHEGRQTEPTSGGDNRNNTSVLDLLKGLLNEVENSHQHMFDPSYRPITVPRELTEFEHDSVEPNRVKFGDDIQARVKREQSVTPGDFTYPVYKSEPPDSKDVKIKLEKIEPVDDKSGIVKQEQFYDIPVFDEKDIDVKYGIVKKSDSQPDVKEEKLEDGFDDNSSDLHITGEWEHSNIVATYDLTEDDTMYDEVEQIIACLIDNAVAISKPDTPAPDTIPPNYNINIYINNYITQTADANLGLIDTHFLLNIIQSNQMPPFLMSFKQIENDGNVQIHNITSAVTQTEKQMPELEYPIIERTTVLNENSEKSPQRRANISTELNNSNEDNANHCRAVLYQQYLESKTSGHNDSSKENYIRDTEELLPCTTKEKYQPNITRLCDKLLDQLGPSAPESLISLNEAFIENTYPSKSSGLLKSQQSSTSNKSQCMHPCPTLLNEDFIENQYSSEPSAVIQSEQPSTFNNSNIMCTSSDCLILLNEAFLRETQYPIIPPPENFALASIICDNVGQQDCPTDNVCSIALVPTTDKPNPHENIQSPCYVQDQSPKMLPSTKSRVTFQTPIVAQTILSATTITISGNGSKMSGQISTVTNRVVQTSELPEQTSPLKTKPSKHASSHNKGTEGSNQSAYADDLLMETVNPKPQEQMLCDECTVGYFIEAYMEELANEYKFPTLDDEVVDVPLVEENKHNLVYNSSRTSCYIEPYTAVGYAAECSVKNKIDQSIAYSKSIPQSEESENDLGICDSKPEIPWNIVNLKPNIKISYVDKEKSETDLSNEVEIPKHLPPLLPIPVTSSMIFTKTCVKNEPYAKKLAKEFSAEELTSDSDIAWDKILLPSAAKIRRIPVGKPKLKKEVEEVLSNKSLPCVCKSGYVLPVRVHRNIDLLCRNVKSSKNEASCVEASDSPSTIVILLPRSRHFLSTKFPVEPNNSSSLTKTKKSHKGKPLKSILSDKELKSTTSKKSVTFMDSKSGNSKKKKKLVPSSSESSFCSCKCCKSVTSKPNIPKSQTRKTRIKVKISKSQDSNNSSTPRSLTPVPTKEKIDKVKSSLSTALLKTKPDRVFMALSACETEFKPIKQALNNVQEKLRNLNMPELDCIFNKEPAYTNTLPTVGKEQFNISAGYKLDQSNQGSFKYNGMNSNGMNNQYNTFSGIGCSCVSPTLGYSHTSNTYLYPNEMYHSFRAPERLNYPRQHQNYYSLPDSDWCGINYGNDFDFPSPAESIASKYSFRNFDQYDYDEDFCTNLYEPDYIPSQYSVSNSGKHKKKRKDRSKDKKVPSTHNYNEDSRNVPGNNYLQDPYFDDDESSYDYCSNYRNSDKHLHDSSKSKMRCNCKKPHKTASRIKSSKKNRTRRSKTNVKTSDSQCTVYDVIKSLFMPPDGKHNNKNTPRLTRKDIENLYVQFHAKKDKPKRN